MRDLKIMTGFVYFCAAGVLISFAGGVYTAVREHREASKPVQNVLPLPAGEGSAQPPVSHGKGSSGLPVPAQ